MESNFSFLQGEFSGMHEYAYLAEQYAYTDPMYSAILCRKSLEQFVKWLYDNDEDLEIPYDTTLNSLIHEQSFQRIVPPTLFRNINLLRKIGNNAAHSNQRTTDNESVSALRILHDFVQWVVRLYSKGQTPALVFNEWALPAGDVVTRSKKEAEALQKQFEDTRQRLDRANKELEQNTVLMQALQKRLDAVHIIKQQNKASVVPSYSIGEAQTRQLYIDTLLKEAGWDITISNCTEYEVTGMPHASGIGYADYVLWGDDGKPLAVVEAKKTKIDARKGQRQAELYADSLEKMSGQRPVIFFTNGFETHIWDDAGGYPPRVVQGFYSKDELQLLINRRGIDKPLVREQINKEIAGRYYQEEAIKRVMATLDNKARGALLVMATGSGKTRTAAAIVDLLTKANRAKKILFLADRNALVTQAKNNFNTYLPNLTAIDLTQEAEDTASRIVFSTYPTILNRIDSVKTEGHRYYGVGHFDVVIIDEAHRSVYMKYRAIFEYFDAIYIGLTATPKADQVKDTYELFGLEQHNPTYAYELDQAVFDKFLKPPKAVRVPLKFPRDGIKYDELSEEDKAEYEREFLDKLGSLPESVSSSAVNTWLFNKDTVKKVLSELMERGLKIEGGDLIGKTIIFAKNHEHALFIEKCFNEMFPSYAGKMLRIIDNQSYNVQDLIYRFSDKENKEFMIAVSVDMLDTGIDIPEIINLVFFKPVRSKAKFWQMVGRGTRLSPNLFGPDLHKEFFYIFDICGNIEFFTADVKEIEAQITGTLSQRIFDAKLDVAYAIQELHSIDADIIEVANSFKDDLHNILTSFSEDDFRVRMKLKYVVHYQQKEAWETLSHVDILDLKREISHLYNDEDAHESAKRFDLLILKLMLCELENGNKSNYINKIRMSVAGLLKKMSIPAVKQKEPLIRRIQEDEYWEKASITTHNQTRLELRELMQYIESDQQRALYTNFSDDFTGNIEEVEIINGYSNLEAYKKRVEKFIRENQNHVTIHRIRTNKPITKAELDELERLLFSIDDNSDKNLLTKIAEGQPLGKFIRSIIGLDINVAKEAFADFLNNRNHSASQIHFINTIIDFLCVNGTIDNSMLFEKPFTNIDHQGISGVFTTDEATQIITIIGTINANAIQVA
jgi:type I restriction enzyme, R subunit